MGNVSIHFVVASRNVDILLNTLKKPGHEDDNAVIKALLLLKRIKENFELAKGEKIDLNQVKAVHITELKTTLTRIEKLFFKNTNQNLVNKDEIQSQLQEIRQDLATIAFEGFTQSLKEFYGHFHHMTVGVSRNIKTLMEQYSEIENNPEKTLEYSTAVAINLGKFSENIRKFKAMLDNYSSNENVKFSNIPPKSFKRFEKLIGNFTYEFRKIVNSVAHFAEQNDIVITQIIYNCDFCSDNVEKTVEGDYKDRTVVLQGYRNAIFKCFEDTKMMIQNSPEGIMAILDALDQLRGMISAKNEYVLLEVDNLKALIKTNENDLSDALKVRKFGKARHIEEKILRLKEDLHAFEKAGFDAFFDEVEDYIDYIDNASPYKDFTDFDQFSRPIYPPQSHWLLAPLRPRNDDEVQQLRNAFRTYKKAVNELKALVNYDRDKKEMGIIRFMMEFKNKVMNKTTIAKHPDNMPLSL